MTGLGSLVRLALRRSRWFYLAWVLALTAVVPLTAAAYEQIVDPGNADLLIATMTNNPTMRAMLGPPVDLTSAGGFTVWRVGTFAAAMAGIMAVLGVVRSTRAEEEDGRTELLRSGATGRHAPLVAGVLVALLACAALGVAVAASMTAVGEPVAGSVAFGAGLALVGATFAGVGAVAAQLTASARTAKALGLWTLAAAYTLRAVADGSTDEAVRQLAWGSPVQWMALTRPYADERWWVLALPAVTAVVLLTLAVGLETRRDHGSGLWAARRGRAEAVASLATPGALVRRLQRGQVIGWTIGLLLFALAMGSLSTAFDDMLEQVPQLRLIFQRMGGGAEQLVDAFFVALLSIVAVLIAVVAVQLFSRLAAEEERGHAELVLSTGATRGRLLGAYLLVAALAPALMLVAVGAVMALNQARATGDWGIVAEVAGAGAALAPGGLLVLGIAVLLHGWAPRLAWLTWVVVAWSLVMVWVGAALDLPEWLTELTPWSPLPQLPVEDMDWLAVLGMTGLAALLLGLGAVGYRRRDITST
ncbi:hypothetical protein [uncultured Serinicoccus sp.]|uniref:ABC transporter permease n=1 Tax=uncultured Serinicoccus sp. TaxID=735514 RepID=UPI0026125B50|nr:hypothetical protein [uncultured Serinicoccus sp.]